MSNYSHINDLLALGNELVALIHAHEIDAAAARIAEATRNFHLRDVESRGREIQEINKSLHAIETICKRLRFSVGNLPVKEQVFAKLQIEDVIEKIFNPELHALRKRKNELSKPR